MSSINTTFQPMTDMVVVDNTAPVQIKDAQQKGCSSFRLVARVANCYVAWGRQAAGLAAAAPAAVGPAAMTAGQGGIIGLTVGVPCYIEVPPDSFFVGSAVFATANVEIIGGIGGVGG